MCQEKRNKVIFTTLEIPHQLFMTVSIALLLLPYATLVIDCTLRLAFSIFIPHYIKVRGIMLYPRAKIAFSYPSVHLRVLTYDFEIWYKAW